MQAARSLFRFIASRLANKNIYLVKSLPYLQRRKRLDLARLDYVRLSSLELAAEEIYRNNISGSVAEVGVYRGDFAKYLNIVFPDRKLYLFDTFEGFDKRDVHVEVKSKYSGGQQDFSDTSTEVVLSKMIHRSNCIVRKGFFPETAKGISEKFCFVSLDADLYAPILSGLEFFYPLLSPGGYIFVHDFNNDEYKGARQAVQEFCSRHQCTYVPVGDIGGTAVIGKPLSLV
jgi:O-methyltransferase